MGHLICQIDLWVCLETVIQLGNCSFKFISRLKLVEDFLQFFLYLGLALSWVHALVFVDHFCAVDSNTCYPLLILAVKNDFDPPLNVPVLRLMLLDNLIRVPDLLSSRLDQLVDHSLDNSDAHLIVLSLVVMVNRDHILMNN